MTLLRVVAIKLIFLTSFSSLSQKLEYIDISLDLIKDQYRSGKFEMYSKGQFEKLMGLTGKWKVYTDYYGKREVPQYGTARHDFKYSLRNDTYGFLIHVEKSFPDKKAGKRFKLDSFFIHQLTIVEPNHNGVKWIIKNEKGLDTLTIGVSKLGELSGIGQDDKHQINSNTIMVRYNSMSRLYFVAMKSEYVLRSIGFGL